jgi:WD40 repeat protein
VKGLAFTPDGQFLLVGSRELVVVNLLSKDCRALSDAGPVAAIRISPDGLSVDLGGGAKNTWELFWDYEYPSGELLVPPVLARLKVFLEQHRPFASDDPFDPHFLSRSGHPGWNSSDFDDLMVDLAQRGLGWASSEAIERGLRDRLRILSESGNARTHI